MAQNQAQKQLAQYDTDIAVLKVEFKNLDTKFDTALEDVRSDIKKINLYCASRDLLSATHSSQ